VDGAADQKQKENHCKAAQATSHDAKTEMMKLKTIGSAAELADAQD
jgi:hypothetical protein